MKRHTAAHITDFAMTGIERLATEETNEVIQHDEKAVGTR